MTQYQLALDVELDELRAAVVRLQAENERLLRLPRLSPQEAAAPGPAQSGMFERPPGPVHDTRAGRRRLDGPCHPTTMTPPTAGTLPSGRAHQAPDVRIRADRTAATARQPWMHATPGRSPKRALRSAVMIVRFVAAAVAAMIRSCAPRRVPSRYTLASSRPCTWATTAS